MSDTPVPNSWKRGTDYTAIVLLIVGVLVVAGGLWASYRMGKATNPTPLVIPPASIVAPPAPPYIKISETTSTGGKEVNRSDAIGPSFKGSGDGVKANDAVFGQPKVNSETGSAEGGSLAGDFSSMVKGSQLLVRILGVLVCLGCGALAFLNFKKNPLDVHFYGGLALGSVGGLVVAIEPDLFWVGLIGMGIAALANFLPSITASRVLEASKNYEDFITANADIKERWIKFRAGVSAADKNTIDTVIIPKNT